MDDSVRLCLFQRSLTGAAAKWYIELQGGSFKIFNELAMEFLMHYQLPIRYEIGMYLLASMCKILQLTFLIIYMSGDEDVK
jgi:hypothetical protein